jgi:hypothetical protein
MCRGNFLYIFKGISPVALIGPIFEALVPTHVL